MRRWCSARSFRIAAGSSAAGRMRSTWAKHQTITDPAHRPARSPRAQPARGRRTHHYLRLDGNDYAVHPAMIGRRVELVADLDLAGWRSCGRHI
jgi:hypothetical protein